MKIFESLREECYLIELISDAIQKYPDKVVEFKKGKTGLLGLFVGEVMKATKGTGDVKKINSLVLKTLNE